MTVEVGPGIFRMEIPLPGNPLRAINSYLIQGDGRWLMIDTGMGRPECREAMAASLRELAVDLERTDIFVTHFHADHLGLVSELARVGCRVYFNQPEVDLVHMPDHWEKVSEVARLHGFPEDELQAAMARHPGRRYQAPALPELTLLREGDQIPIGPYRLTCVETPGHTPGHLCLYDAGAKILFSGDHVLKDITPNLSGWVEERESLCRYLESLQKIAGYDVDCVFPGHRTPFRDLRGRIAELRRHHEARAVEVLSILREGARSAYHVASRMTWSIRCNGWSDFPVQQKWFAGGEALAHLQYLQRQGQVLRELDEGKYRYRIAS
jgi:glyoxylase-like metal-dependent hydrolase (beta-lactamase superfamily II)